jgi:hypothetical protein
VWVQHMSIKKFPFSEFFDSGVQKAVNTKPAGGDAIGGVDQDKIIEEVIKRMQQNSGADNDVVAKTTEAGSSSDSPEAKDYVVNSRSHMTDGRVISDDELAKIKKQEYERGKGEMESKIAEERRQFQQETADVIMQISTRFNEISEQVRNANQFILNDAAELSYQLAKKLSVEVEKVFAHEQITNFFKDHLNLLVGEPKLLIKVSSGVADELIHKIEKVFSQCDYIGVLSVVRSAKVPLGDCEVHWDGGMLKKDRGEFVKKFEENIEKAIEKVASKAQDMQINNDNKFHF